MCSSCIWTKQKQHQKTCMKRRQRQYLIQRCLSNCDSDMPFTLLLIAFLPRMINTSRPPCWLQPRGSDNQTGRMSPRNTKPSHWPRPRNNADRQNTNSQQGAMCASALMWTHRQNLFFFVFFVWTQGYGVHANVKAHDVHANVYAWTQLAVYVWTKTYDVHASVFMTLVLSLFLHRSQILDLILQKAAFQCYRKRRGTKGRRTNYKNIAICKRSNVIWVTWFWFLLSVGLQKRGVAVDAAPRS